MRSGHDILNNTNLALFAALDDHDAVILNDWKVLLVLHYQRIHWVKTSGYSGLVHTLVGFHGNGRPRQLFDAEQAILFRLRADGAIGSKGTQLIVFLEIPPGLLYRLDNIVRMPFLELLEHLLVVVALLDGLSALLSLSLMPPDGALDLSRFPNVFQLPRGPHRPRSRRQLAHDVYVCPDPDE